MQKNTADNLRNPTPLDDSRPLNQQSGSYTPLNIYSGQTAVNTEGKLGEELPTSYTAFVE
jgi:hypothetical protein